MKTVSRLSLSLALSVLLFSSCTKESATTPGAAARVSSNDIPETAPARQVAVTTSINSNVGGFYSAVPARYDSTSKTYPLLVFLHGVGELGNGTTDLPKLLGNAVPRLLNQKTFPAQFTVNGSNYSFIVLNPQFKTWPQPADVNAVIDYAVAHYRVDQSRIYVAGLSMGGGNSWDYAMAYPSRIAAVVPICGATWPSRDQLGSIAAASLPVWAFHNSDDGTVGVNTTITNVDNVNSFKPTPAAQKTIWATGGHDAWTKATDPATRECGGKNMYEWMLQYSRPVKK